MSQRRLQITSIALSCGLLVFVALASAKTDNRVSRVTKVKQCSPGHVEEVKLPGPVPIDEIRVDVSRLSPRNGASNVYVWDGRFTRVVRIRGQLSQRLAFSPPIMSDRLHVSVEPVFSAKRTACVDRVELRVAGAAVAHVTP